MSRDVLVHQGELSLLVVSSASADLIASFSQDISLDEPVPVAPPLPSETDVEKGSATSELDDRDKASSESGATTPTTLCEVQEMQEKEGESKTLPVVDK